jgi:hypothetical protein
MTAALPMRTKLQSNNIVIFKRVHMARGSDKAKKHLPLK